MRNVAITLAAILALTVYGCGKKEETAQAPAAPAVQQAAPAEQAPATTAMEQAPATATEQAAAPAEQAPAAAETK
jgi:nucleoid-associated protein YgaU